MTDQDLHSTARIGKHPVHPMLVPFPIVCFVGTLLTDVTYWRTAEMMWANFSAWLLTAGLLLGVLSAIAGLIDFLRNRLVRAQRPAWPHVIGNALVLILSFFNALVHSRDAWASVVPTGLILSAVVVAIILFTAWTGRSLVYRHHVGADQ
ncbi:DUF2231 domain-containing protein [Rhizobium sp. RCC_161_2]|uniref:DUF2231 domain-containing protein n=1 Tax=Rhizobium sp. RCC_161_2 TaxID=3239219 RepID=UPI00352665D9